MCGFVAVVSRERVAPEVLEAMRDRLEHRGPDGAGAWVTSTASSTVALATRRLSIIDLSHDADQPMVAPDGTLALAHNGEIYNYLELRADLERAGRRFRTRSDTEVLLTAYAEWGDDCLDRLNGMFAFAIWDERRGELFVARDRFGEKPLFYAELPGGGIAFASEMKALFAHPDLAARMNGSVVDAYTAGAYYEDTAETFFAGVRRVLPAHALRVDGTGRIVDERRWWTPDYTPSDAYDEEAAVTTFRSLLERSVSMRLRSDVPVGTSLSGGLDSSLIVGVLARLRERSSFSQNTFSGRFDDADPTLSEGPYVDLVVRHTGVRSYGVAPTPDGLAAESTILHWHQEEPFLSASIFLQWCVMRLAHKHRTTVLLDGQGADELLAGYQFYFPSHQLDLLAQGRLVRLLRETTAFTRRLRRASRGYADVRRRFNPEVALSLAALTRAWRVRHAVSAGAYGEGVPPPGRDNRLRRILAEALQYNSLPMLLRYADRNAMAFSRETRFPYLDYDLVDFCVSLPDDALVNAGWQKYVLRRAADGILPPEIQWRADKVGYAAPLDVWLRGRLRGWAEKRLFDGPITAIGAYDRGALWSLWEAHQAGRGEHSWALWRWISLGEWLDLLERNVWRTGIGDRPSARAASGG